MVGSEDNSEEMSSYSTSRLYITNRLYNLSRLSENQQGFGLDELAPLHECSRPPSAARI